MWEKYFLIMVFGFAPLIILIKNSVINISFFNFKLLVLPFLLLNILVPFHWLMFIDWGRAVNITYVSSLLFFFYLYQNNFIKTNFKLVEKKFNQIFDWLKNKTFLKSKKKLVIFSFIIFAFGWSPPTLLSADVNSFPGYRIPYKTIKFLLLQ